VVCVFQLGSAICRRLCTRANEDKEILAHNDRAPQCAFNTKHLGFETLHNRLCFGSVFNDPRYFLFLVLDHLRVFLKRYGVELATAEHFLKQLMAVHSLQQFHAHTLQIATVGARLLWRLIR